LAFQVSSSSSLPFILALLFLYEHCFILCEVALQAFNGDDVDRLTAVLCRGGDSILD